MGPQMCRSTNRRSNLTEPEIWFKIVDITPELLDVRPETADREQTVEITLGSKGTFENGNIGTLMRRVPADRVVRCRPAVPGQAETAAGAQDTPGG